MPAAIYDFPALAKQANLLNGGDVHQPMAVKTETPAAVEIDEYGYPVNVYNSADPCWASPDFDGA